MSSLTDFGSHSDEIVCLDFFDNKLISGGADNCCQIWDTRTNSIAMELPMFSEEVTAVHLVENTAFIGSGNLFQFDLRKVDEGKEATPIAKYSVNKDEINGIDVCENFLASCDDNGDIQVVNMNTGRLQSSLSKHTNICSSIRFNPNNKMEIISGGLDSMLYFWHVKRKKVTRRFNMTETHEKSKQMVNPPFVHSIDISMNGKFVAGAIGDSSLVLLDARKKEIIDRKMDIHTGPVSCICFPSFDESKIVSAANDRTLRVWNIPGFNDSTELASDFVIDLPEGPNQIVSGNDGDVFVCDCSETIKRLRLI
eukprot:TRINITY_DN774375_c0_g1_i1.p1 TRINITY_DN774375_c0_g1~~TRINITY_DN774375_c0_g1_i1.p1  ORF type:complete len:310 (+),score=86.92 TRINITY_DN774375_c0_g1_i1:106-1035(+)